MLVELQADTIHQGELDFFTAAEEPEHAASRDRTKLMTAMDSLNGRYGKGSVQLGSASVSPATRPWSMKADRRTPRYTTVCAEMPVARA